MRTSVPSKLPFILVFFLVIAIAVATVLENRFDTHYAMQHVYGAWWFIGLWALLALAGCWLIYKRKMWRQPSVFLLHLSFLVILIGALTTHITSHRGMVHLREGETSRSYWAKDNQGLYTLTEQMPFYLALKDFQVLYDADGITPSDYVSQVVIATKEGKEETTISMNNIGRVKGFRIYQTSFDDDLAGSVFTISYDPWGTAITYIHLEKSKVKRPLSPALPQMGGSLRFERKKNVQCSMGHNSSDFLRNSYGFLHGNRHLPKSFGAHITFTLSICACGNHYAELYSAGGEHRSQTSAQTGRIPAGNRYLLRCCMG